MAFTNSNLLRRSSQLAGPAGPARDAEERERIGRVVVADSDSGDLEHIASILRGMNFTVLTARDGRTALGLVRRHSPQLVLASLELPQIDGYMLAQRLREQVETERIAFMFLLRAGELPDQLVGHETFAHDYIQKPISIPEFKSRVTALLNLVGRRDEATRKGTGDAAATSGSVEAERRAAGDPRDWLTRMQELVDEMDDCLNQVGRGLCQSEPGAQEAAPPGDEPVADSDYEIARRSAGRILQGRRSRDRFSLPDLETDDDRYRHRLSGEEGSPDEVVHLVDRYRSEFREMQGEGKPVAPESDSEESQSRHEQGEKGGYGGPSPEDFDPALLGPATLKFEIPVLERVETEEATNFARESFAGSIFEDDLVRNDALYTGARDYVLRSIRKAMASESPDLKRADQVVESLLASLADSDALMIEATRRDPEFSISAHCVNVTVLAIGIARQQRRSEQFQRRVGLAGLLHELGVVRLPEKLVFKEGRVSSDELILLRRRPLFSAVILQESNFRVDTIAEIVGQVFEREDGSGFPLGLFGGEMREEARLLAIADVFEACIHRRPYRRPLAGYHTLYHLTQSKGFHPALVKSLIETVSLFPYNEFIRLDSGEVGKVVAIDRKGLSRPRVRLVLDSDGRPIGGKEVDLGSSTAFQIRNILTLDEVRSMASGTGF